MKPLLLVDGYNVIGAWRRAVTGGWTVEESRERLQRALEDYAGYSGVEVLLVFDGHLSSRKQRTSEQNAQVTCVFTKQGETADHYIEAAVALLSRRRPLQVATSDSVEQTVVWGRGAERMSARELLNELEEIRERRKRAHAPAPVSNRNPLEERLSPEQRTIMERMRRQKE